MGLTYQDKVSEARTLGKAEWLRDYVTFDEPINSVSEDLRGNLSSDDSWIYDHIHEVVEVSSIAFDVVALSDRVGFISFRMCTTRWIRYIFGPITSVVGGALRNSYSRHVDTSIQAQPTVGMKLRLHKQIKSLEKKILTLEHVLKTITR
jgi:hypothetical protein